MHVFITFMRKHIYRYSLSNRDHIFISFDLSTLHIKYRIYIDLLEYAKTFPCARMLRHISTGRRMISLTF